MRLGGGKDACCEKTLLIAGACQFLAGDVDGCVGSVGMSSDELFKVTTEALEALIAEGSVIADENKDSNLVSLLPSSLQ